jgi:hypothetical protein
VLLHSVRFGRPPFFAFIGCASRLLLLRMSLRRRLSSADKKQSGVLTVGSSEVSGFKHPPTSNNSGRRSFLILVAILVLSIYTYFAFQPSTALSDSYALCSRDGNNIYTVDEKNSQTQCIVVHGSYIVDTGGLRKSCASLSASEPLTPAAEDVQERWHGFSLQGIIPPLTSLEVRYIKQGAIVLPGLAGQ